MATKFEYLVRRYQYADATDKINEEAKKGFRVLACDIADGKVLVVLEKEKRGPGRPPKKKEEPKVEVETPTEE